MEICVYCTKDLVSAIKWLSTKNIMVTMLSFRIKEIVTIIVSALYPQCYAKGEYWLLLKMTE